MPMSPEVPEADALEQEHPIAPETAEIPDLPRLLATFEVPEADAIDQAREVVLDDDDDRR
jgi:hypothetical protein